MKELQPTSKKSDNSAASYNAHAAFADAKAAYASDDPGAAIDPLRSVLIMDPGRLDATLVLAGAFARTGATGPANSWFNKVNKLETDESRHWRMHASVLIKARQLTMAHQLSRKILATSPADVSGMKTLARVHSMWGHNEAVTHVLLRLHGIEPNDPGIATGLARSAMSNGPLEDAERLCRRALHLAESKAERSFDLGRVLRALGKLEEADIYLDRAASLDPALSIPRAIVRGTAIEDDFRVTMDDL
ncbi:MAG: tetratricopeptide repeat protein [Alphaproteobacteria bacterium]|nr:tetratricopeptide repeat protein [Alphaproteobacteria bacterium]